jgi:hypothetical protein
MMRPIYQPIPHAASNDRIISNRTHVAYGVSDGDGVCGDDRCNGNSHDTTSNDDKRCSSSLTSTVDPIDTRPKRKRIPKLCLKY